MTILWRNSAEQDTKRAKQGPKLDNEQFDKILSIIETSSHEGVKCVASGGRVEGVNGYIL